MKNRQAPNLIIGVTEHLPEDMLQILVVFYLVWKFPENIDIRFPQDTTEGLT